MASYQERFTDADVARDGAMADLARIATAQGWSNVDQAYVASHIEAAYDAADRADWWGADVGTFWKTLWQYAATDPRYKSLANGAAWGQFLDAAVVATKSVAESERLASWWGQAQTFSEGVAEDVTALRGAVAEAADTANELGKAASKPTWMIAAAVALVALVALSRR